MAKKKEAELQPTAGSGAEIQDFLDAIPEPHQPIFSTLHRLILELAPQAEQSLQWGTLSYKLDGSLFALSANKKFVNLYILTLGLLAEHSEALKGIPQGKCVLRFAPGSEPPLDVLRQVMTIAVERKSS